MNGFYLGTAKLIWLPILLDSVINRLYTQPDHRLLRQQYNLRADIAASRLIARSTGFPAFSAVLEEARQHKTSRILFKIFQITVFLILLHTLAFCWKSGYNHQTFVPSLVSH